MMYTERDRPFLLRRPLQTSLNTTFSPAFRRRDYPLRIFNHTLWGGFDCLFRVREVKEHSLKALIIGSIRVLSAKMCLQTRLGKGVGKQECCPGPWLGLALLSQSWLYNPDSNYVWWTPLRGGGRGVAFVVQVLWNPVEFFSFPGKEEVIL